MAIHQPKNLNLGLVRKPLILKEPRSQLYLQQPPHVQVPHGLQMLWMFNALGHPGHGLGALDSSGPLLTRWGTISDLMAKKRTGKPGGAAGDHHMLGSMGPHVISHSSIQQPGLLSRTWEEAVLEGCSWRQELYEGAIHWHGTQPAHGGCWTRLHVTITRHNQ